LAEALILQAQIQGLRTSVEGRLRADADGGAQTSVPWKPGEQVTATVEAHRAGDRFLLRAGQFLFDVALPIQAQLGERMRLQFLSSAPRVTFALVPNEADSASPSGASVRSPPVEISPSARSLAALVASLRGGAPPGTNTAGGAAAGVSAQAAQGAASSSRTPPAHPIFAAQALLPAPPADSRLLAAALRTAIEESGVFYESHLRQWLAGERSTEALLREPQGRVTPALPPSLPAAPPDEATAGAERAPHAASAPPAAATRAEPVDPQLLTQIRMQLETLDARQLVWQGQPWPGQPIEWRIDDPPQREGGQGAEFAWTSQLRLVLPRLGEIEAQLALGSRGLSLRLSAHDARSGEVLRAAQADLAHALEQAGLRLTAFDVSAAAQPARDADGGAS
jgi:hypothetical protein